MTMVILVFVCVLGLMSAFLFRTQLKDFFVNLWKKFTSSNEVKVSVTPVVANKKASKTVKKVTKKK